MIEKRCFGAEWIEARKAEHRLSDAALVEKTILAFALLGSLVRLGVPLIFKGGTSLLLRLPVMKRLSIDVDIVCELEWADLETALAVVATRFPFVDWQEDDRGKHRIPERRHYKFFYKPCFARGKVPSYVLLDVVKEPSLHPVVNEVPIRMNLFEVEQELKVRVPTVEGLLGDKLAAFAPNTIGVPLREGSQVQVMKQLFDVGELFNLAQDFRQVSDTYGKLSAVESGYRGGRFSRSASLLDTFETSRSLTVAGLKGTQPDLAVEQLLKGREALRSHLVGARFGDMELKVAAAKAGCLAKVFLDGNLKLLEGDFRFTTDGLDRLKSLRLAADPQLEGVKRLAPEAFHYWALAYGALAQ